MGNEPTLRHRVLKALCELPDGKAGYHALMYRVWPPEAHPKAFRHSSNGGPPGVAMSFGRALRELREKHYIKRMEGDHPCQWEIMITSAGRKELENAR